MADIMTPSARRPGGTTIGIDLGATHVRAAIVSAEGTITAATRHRLPTDPAARRRAAADAAASLLQANPQYDVGAVGLAVAGTVADGTLTWSANLGLSGIDYRSQLQEVTGRPAAVINDARAAALAEAHRGAGIGAAAMLMVTVGTGIGGALVIGGRLHAGTGHAGEIGHLLISPRGPRCRCGHRGCWEQMAGGLALDAAAGRHAAAHPTSRIAALAGGQPGAASLATAAGQGDKAAIRIISRHAGLFARGLDSLCAVAAPDLLVLGGGIIARRGPIREGYLSAARNLRWHSGETRIAVLGDDAGMLGAALAALAELHA
jgi:glucokinase